MAHYDLTQSGRPQRYSAAFGTTEIGARFSIVIPARNEARFLPGLLKSIDANLRESIEIIVVDVNSIDGTSDIARTWGCRVVTSDRDLTPSEARNLGWPLAQATTIVFLDADVEITALWAEELQSLDVQKLESEHILTGDQYHISSNPSLIERLWFAPLRSKPPSYINGGNIIIPKRLLERIGGFNEQLETGEDVDLCQRAKASGATIKINERLAVRHEGYPKDVANFLKRERWHGKGDLQSLRTFLGSSVALASAAFIALHFALLASIFAMAIGYTALVPAMTFLGLIIVECTMTALYKYRRATIMTALKATPVVYLYYLGRAWSLLDRIRNVGR